MRRTYQVTLDALKLSPCYPAFLITAEVPKVYMHQLWDTIQKIKDTAAYQFKLDKKKCRIDTECDMLSYIHTDQMHQPWRTFVVIINRCTAGKTTGIDRLKELRPQILKATPKKAKKFKKVASPTRKLSPIKLMQAKKPSKKSTTMPTAGVVIRDTPSESMPKKKTPAKVVRGKGMDLLSDVALLEAAQLKKTLKKSKLETHKLHASGSGDGVGSQPKVHDEQEDKTTSTDKGTDSGDDDSNDDDSDEVTKDDDNDDVASDADGDKEASDSEKTKSDEDENPNLNQNDDEEEEYEEVYVRTPDSIEFNEDDEEYEELYKDVNVRLKDTKHEEEGKRDEEMTDAGRDDNTKQTTYEKVKDDEHVILTTVHDTQNTEVPFRFYDECQGSSRRTKYSDSTSSQHTCHDFSSLLGFDQRVSALEKELSQFKQADYSAQLLETIKSQIPTMVDAQLSTRLEDSIKKYSRSYTAEFKNKDKDERKRYIDLVEKSVKQIIKDKVKSQLPQILPKKVSDYVTPAAASLTEFELKKILLDKIQKNQGLKKWKTSKDAKPSRGSKSKESNSSSSKGTKSQPKSSVNSAPAEEPMFEVADIEMPLNQRDDVGNTDDQPNVEAASRDDWFKKPERPPM
ncbi:hypothetical protein Tco_1353580 [Tanacetum coccineum]